jgi:hypothetical protein
VAQKIKRGGRRAGAGRKGNPLIKRIAEEAQITSQGAANMIADATAAGISVEDLKTARLRKVKLEGDRIEFLLAVTKGEHIPRAEVESEGLALGMSVKAQLLAWTGSLPGRLEGLTAAQMVPIFEGEVVKVLQALAGKSKKGKRGAR